MEEPRVPAFYEAVTEFIFAEDPPEKADIIFIPGSGIPDLARRAAQLYLEGYAPRILPSGRYAKAAGRLVLSDPPPGRHFQTEWDYLSWVLQGCGVAREAILREDRAEFTWENAVYSRKVLENAGVPVRTALLVCKSWHARRALIYYQQQFPEVSFKVIPVAVGGVRKDTWHTDAEKTALVLGELKRMGEQFSCFLPTGKS